MRSIASVMVLLAAVQVEAAPTTLRRDIVSGPDHRVIGGETCRVISPQERVCEWSFTDRGLGPKLTSRIVVDGEGLPTLIDNRGLGYDHDPVDETFRRGAEHGFYVSKEGAPEEEAVLARALLRRADRRMPLLPSGEASIVRVGTLEVTHGAQHKRVTQYELAGLDFMPETLWLDDDNELFCEGETILAGWEDTGAALSAAEGRRATERHTRMLASLARTPTGPLAIVHARLFDAATATTEPNSSVVVEHGRFTAVGPDARVAIPRGAEIVDAAGKTLLPGFWDMHTHPDEVRGLMMIASGITTARHMSSSALHRGSLSDAFNAGTAVGPRILNVGLVDGAGPGESLAELVHDERELRAAIDRDADAGFPQVKVYNSFPRALVPAFVEEAHRRGLRASGHVPNGLKAADLVRDGVDELQHAYFFFLNFLPEGEMLPLARFRVFADHAGEVDLSSPAVRAFVKTLAARHVDLDLTLVSGEEWLMARKGAVMPTYAAVADRLPVQVRRMLVDGSRLPVDAGTDARYRASFAATLKLARLAHDAGVPIAVGTDANVSGFSFDRELELLVEAGLPAAEVLRMATLGNARIMKRDGDLGSIAPGKLADFVLVDGDPTRRISDARRAVLVGKGGTLFVPSAIYRSLGIAP